jgi:hypothetical protein
MVNVLFRIFLAAIEDFANSLMQQHPAGLALLMIPRQVLNFFVPGKKIISCFRPVRHRPRIGFPGTSYSITAVFGALAPIRAGCIRF